VADRILSYRRVQETLTRLVREFDPKLRDHGASTLPGGRQHYAQRASVRCALARHHRRAVRHAGLLRPGDDVGIASHGETLAPLMRVAGFRYILLGIENILEQRRQCNAKANRLAAAKQDVRSRSHWLTCLVGKSKLRTLRPPHSLMLSLRDDYLVLSRTASKNAGSLNVTKVRPRRPFLKSLPILRARYTSDPIKAPNGVKG
jgi:hypothetical protein